MADLDARARDIRQLDIDRRRVEARQFVFDRTHCFEHLAGQKQLGPPLRLGNRQHHPLPPTPLEKQEPLRRRSGQIGIVIAGRALVQLVL
jgi:hypothetical protein